MIHTSLGDFADKNKGYYFEAAQKEMARCWFADDKKGMSVIVSEFCNMYGPISFEWNNPDWVTITIQKSHARYPWGRSEVM